MNLAFTLGGLAAALYGVYRVRERLRLSRAKHPSLAGHARISRRLARLLPYYAYRGKHLYGADGAGEATIARRREGLERLSRRLSERSPKTLAETEALQDSISDLRFVNANRVPFQFRELAMDKLPVGAVASATRGVQVCDLDGNWAYDLAGSYGVNLLGYDFYKHCIDRGVERARELGPILGPYHPLVRDNVEKIRQISGLDEVSFHMSGTEAVMQAVRLARYHTRRSHAVVFCGAYHGWWDGVQTAGHNRSLSDVYMLSDLSEHTLDVLRHRRDIACVLINPLQALHPNASASSDAMLINSSRAACFDKAFYSQWLKRLRAVCSQRGIVLIFDEVFVGFRLGQRGAQEFFDVDADMVTYGKTIGGGLPVGVLAGRRDLMKRYRNDRPADLCFARGTFNSHPYVMATTNEFLKVASSEAFRAEAAAAADTWNARAAAINDQLEERELPIRMRNLSSIWMVVYTQPGRYNWLLQYYLRAEGLSLSWVGTGRFIFSHNYSDDDFSEVSKRIITAAEMMRNDGWWTVPGDLSNRSIQQQVMRELLRRRAGLPVH